MHLVKLTYFTPRGNYYTEGEYIATTPELWQILEDVKSMSKSRCLPGLCGNHSPYIVHVTIPDHPYNVPKILLPEDSILVTPIP